MSQPLPLRNVSRILGVLLVLVVFGGSIASAGAMTREDALAHLLRDFEEMDRFATRPTAETGPGVVPWAERGTYRVLPGDTLDVIIGRTMSDIPIRRSVLRDAFVRANPHAFRSGNPHFLLANTNLRIPGPDDIRGYVFTGQLTPPEPDRNRRHWIRYP